MQGRSLARCARAVCERSPVADCVSRALAPGEARSAVRTPAAMVSATAFSIAAAASGCPKEKRSIIATQRICAAGLATPLPAMSGAEPPDGSYLSAATAKQQSTIGRLARCERDGPNISMKQRAVPHARATTHETDPSLSKPDEDGAIQRRDARKRGRPPHIRSQSPYIQSQSPHIQSQSPHIQS
eukprot:1490107-Pleurochrysis_carterae.AAC.1